MRFRAEKVLLGLAWLLCPASAFAVPWPIGLSTSVPSIVATFGQYRKTLITECPGGVSCSHFQQGISLDPAGGGNSVRAILSGQVTAKDATVPFLTVRASNGMAVTYRYLTSSLSQGATVSANDVLGNISATLLDIEGVPNGATWCNPLYCLGSPFTNYDVVPSSIGPAISEPFFIDANTLARFDTDKPVGRVQFHVVANILGAVYGPSSSHVGVNEVGYTIRPVSIDTETFITGQTFEIPARIRQTYDRLKVDSLLRPGTAYYLPESAEGGPFYYIATNYTEIPSLESNIFHDGEWEACVIAKGAREVGYRTSQPCMSVTFDHTAPPRPSFTTGGASFTYATSTPIVTVSGYDKHGLYSVSLTGPSYSSTSYSSGFQTSFSSQFPSSGVLTNGQYTATVVDLAGNPSTPVSFWVDTNGASSSGNLTQAGLPIPAGVSFPSTATTGSKWTAASGVSTVATAGTVSTFSCVSTMISTVAISQMLSLSSGTYTSTATTCAGVTSTATFIVTTGTRTLEVCVPGNCSGTPANGAAEPTSVTIVGQPLGAPDCSGYPSTLACFCDVAVLTPHDAGDCVFTGSEYRRKYTAPCSQPFDFTVSNSTDISWNLIMRVNGTGYGNNAGLDSAFPTPGNAVAGELHVPQTGAVCPSTSTATPGVSIWSKFWNLVLAAVSMVDDYLEAANKAGKGAFPGSTVSGTGSSVALGEGATIRYSLAWPSGMSISTQTLAIYQWDGAAWSSATVGGQYIYKDPTTSVLTASGTITYSGIYGLFYDAVDSSAPTTTLSFQGSTSSFLTDVFVATDTYVVLIATDPTVNGYASNVATTYYRVDPTTSSPAFSVYTTSVPLSLGFHIFEYRTVDWAGNYEPIKTSTFLVTAGTLFRASSRLSSRGAGLMGFLDYGVLLDVQSRAENSLTLQISSANASPLLSADNIGDIGLGLSQMSARFDVQGGTPTLAALALRSGNSIASTSSVQIAFGYDGEPSMRHAITTTHSTDTVGNRMDFYIWNPLAPSTSSIASMDVLALQASTITSGGVFHVRPVGNPIGGVELIVSDGVTPGGGSVLRADAQTHSSRALKSDIRPLTPQERAAAARDALTLKHSRFNYKSEPPGTPPHNGVMHEDAPASIRGPGGSVSLDARLLNLEVALQETAQRLKRLRERMRRLETR